MRSNKSTSSNTVNKRLSHLVPILIKMVMKIRWRNKINNNIMGDYYIII
jgi:hypothetical protein